MDLSRALEVIGVPGGRICRSKRRLMPRLASTLVVFPIVLLAVASAAQTPTCSCPTQKSPLYGNSGGDSTPLLWRFESYEKVIAHPRRKVICYVRHVENKSTADVWDISWDVAGYRRQVIPARTPRPSCVDYEGEMKATIVQGPLHYGVSSQHYDTAVRPPEEGWVPKKTTSAEMLGTQSLRSDFVLDTQDKEGGLQTSHVIIDSSATYDGKRAVLVFNISNDGKGMLGIFLNIRALPQMYKDVPAAEKPFYLKPNDKVVFKTVVEEKPEFVPATVIFYDANGKQAGLETAGFYVPASGKPMHSDETLWAITAPHH
jgi:hypothetical protein